MLIKTLHVENYRSLRNIKFCPGDLTVVIGANGSGKSNLASAFDFLSDVYDNGLEYAVLKKGGFENIAYRGQRRTKSAVRFTVDYLIDGRSGVPFFLASKSNKGSMRIKHSFAFKASKQTLRADYQVVDEIVEFFLAPKNSTRDGFEEWPLCLRVVKSIEGMEYQYGEDEIPEDGKRYIEFISSLSGRQDKSSPNLATLSFLKMGPRALDGMSVHQFSPQISRTPGAPTPTPKLTSYGENLAALVDWLQRNHRKNWQRVEDSMRDIIKGLESIRVEFSSNKLLTLVFKDERSGKPWTSEEVSDGTIQTLAILCCLADPRVTLLFLEEPENSVHPWIVRQLAKQFKAHSKQTQTILTTHSPIILNVVDPQDVWICHKEEGETLVSHLPTIHPEVIDDWENGDRRLYELLDMGLVSEAVPKGQLS